MTAQTPVFVAPLLSAAYTEGDTPTPLDGTATVTDGGMLSYQWQISVNGTVWYDIADATDPLYSPTTEKSEYMIRGITYYRVIATNSVGGLFPADSLYPSNTLYPDADRDKVTADAMSNVATITIYPKPEERTNVMIKFTDPRLYAKGTANVILTDPVTGNIVYQSDQFTTASISTSVSLNEIRAGIGNPIVAMIPTDASVSVEFTAADFSLYEKAAQVGADVTYGAPVPAAQVVTASSNSIAIDVTESTPVAQLGFSDVYCYVQEVGVSSLLLSVDGGRAYPLDPISGAVSGFVATSGRQYKVWYFVQKTVAQKATITTLMDPKILHFTAAIAVYRNMGNTATSGTLTGWLYVTIPLLKLQANANINGDQGTADTTLVTGQAISASDSVVSPLTDLCGQVGNNLAFYVYSPCSESDVIQGLVVVGGIVSIDKNSTAQIPVRFVMPDNSLAVPTDYTTGFTYTGSGLPSGTSVSTGGVITSGSTAGDGEVEIAYTDGENTFNLPVNVEVLTGT